jgi:hypothetical protein
MTAWSALQPFVVRFSVDFVRDRNERQVRAHNHAILRCSRYASETLLSSE